MQIWIDKEHLPANERVYASISSITVITSPLEKGLLYSWKDKPSPFFPVLLRGRGGVECWLVA